MLALIGCLVQEASGPERTLGYLEMIFLSSRWFEGLKSLDLRCFVVYENNLHILVSRIPTLIISWPVHRQNGGRRNQVPLSHCLSYDGDDLMKRDLEIGRFQKGNASPA